MHEVKIEEQQTEYEVSASYHSDMKCQNYEAKLTAYENMDGTATIEPGDNNRCCFEFQHSDPDRIIALAQMAIAFAKMVKENKKALEADE